MRVYRPRPRPCRQRGDSNEMLRDLFVLGIIVGGFIACTRGAFHALLFYLCLAYFRPEQWVWNDWISSTHLSLLVGVVVVLLTVFSPTAKKIKTGWTTMLLLLFLGQSFVSTVLAQDSVWAWTWWWDFSKVMLISYLILVHVTDA